MEWKEVRLGDVCARVCSGGTPKSTNLSYYGGEIPWLNTKEIDFNRIYSTEKTITDSGLNNSSAKWIVPNTVTVAMYGATAGKSCIVKVPMTTNQACCNLTINDEVADYEFVYYTLKNDYTTLASLANGGAQQNLNAQIIKDYVLQMPSLADQRRIASILSSLDRKIELNNKINADLEEMAQAIFKNWFVDFEPFKDGKFVDSELGMIPEGWKVGRADDFYQINIGKTPPRKEHKWFSTNPADKICVSIANMGNSGIFISDSSEYITKEAVDSHNIIMVPRNTILLSFKLTVGRVAIADKELTTNEAIARFILSDEKYMEYLYLYLKKYDYNSLGSTSSIATAVNSKTIKGMQMLQPSDNAIDAFHIQVNPIFEKIRSLTKESTRLSLLRDTLLPRLMSGEIEVPE